MKNKPVDAPEMTDSHARLRRRILIAGAVAGPAVMTFRSTSAWAVSAGCIIQTGDLPLPGAIIRVDPEGRPVPKIGGATGEEWFEKYELIQISQDPSGSSSQRVVDGSVDVERLQALVYNRNIGITCLLSITTVG